MVRNRSNMRVILVLAIVSLLCVVAVPSGAAVGDTIRIGGGNVIDISADGRFVAFASTFVAGGVNVRDRDTDEDGVFDEAGDISTERVDMDDSGLSANGVSSMPTISNDGRFVAFESEATNLVPNDTNGVSDIFVRDRDTDEDGVFDEAGGVSTKRVSVDSSGTQGNAPSRYATSISADGRFVAFPSEASNLVSGDDTNGLQDFFVRDRDTDEDGVFDEAGGVSTKQVNVDKDGNQGNGHGGYVAISISPNGRYVGFTNTDSNLVPGDTNNANDVFVRDLQLGTIERASVDSFGNQGNREATSSPSISNDGHVAFASTSTNLVSGNDTNGVQPDVFVHDLRTGATQRVSVDSAGTQANGVQSSFVSISAEGCVVAFDSDATNLVSGDTNGVRDIFVHDLHTRTTERVSVDSSGTQGNGSSFQSSISAAGRFVVFASRATNLVSGETSSGSGIFVHERNPAQPIECSAPLTTASATTSSGTDYTSGTPTNKNVTVSLSAQDNASGSGIKNIRYSATGANPISEQTVAAADMPAKFTIDAEGTTIVRYFATDTAGNQESPAKTFTVYIDRSAPDASITSGPSGPTNDTTPTFTFGGSDNWVAAGLLFSYKVVPSGTLPETVNWSDYSPYMSTTLGGATGFAPGSYTFYLKAKDQAGNEDASPAQRSFTVDTTAPTANTTTPQSGTTGVRLDANLTATFSEKMSATSINKSTFKLYRLNSDGTQTQITNVAVSLSKDGLSDGLKAKLNPFGVQRQTQTLLLAKNTKYKGVVTRGARDLAGNPLAQQKSWTFKTRS